MNNSLAEVHPELVSEWSEKNKIKPTEVSIGSHMTTEPREVKVAVISM